MQMGQRHELGCTDLVVGIQAADVLAVALDHVDDVILYRDHDTPPTASSKQTSQRLLHRPEVRPHVPRHLLLRRLTVVTSSLSRISQLWILYSYRMRPTVF